MDKTDMEKARDVSGITKDEAKLIWEQLPDHSYLEMMRKVRAKYGV